MISWAISIVWCCRVDFLTATSLRCGAVARFSPIMRGVVEFARQGGLVLGICNGFQILCESGLLPGALVRNAGLQFVCQPVMLRVEETDTPFTCEAKRDSFSKSRSSTARAATMQTRQP